MKIQVDFFKSGSGKWYSGGEVEIGDIYLFQEEFQQAIVNNQNILMDGWQNGFNYFVVTDDAAENKNNCDYHRFYKALFIPGSFLALERQTKQK